jgi:pimeloyl-ACP methyl ester carboxylesterase
MALKEVRLKNGETITYRERPGGEEVIVLVHGNMTSSKHWDIMIDALDPEYTIFAPDLRGFGGSSYNQRITSIRDFSEDLHDFTQQLGLESFSLVGWSTGGAVSMQFTADHPEPVRKLVLLASASTRGYPFYGVQPGETPDPEKRLRTLEEIEEDAGKTKPMQGLYDSGNREGLKAVWNAVIYTKRQPDAERYEAYVDDMLTQRNLADVYHALNTFNISAVHNGVTQGTDQAKDIRVPVLVLRGDRDLVITQEMTDEIMADLGNNAVFVSLEDNGHSPLIDDLEGLKESIETFLAEKVKQHEA